MQTFVRLSAGFTEDQTTLVIFGTLVFATLLQPIYGAVSDRIGRKPLLIFFGIAGTISTVPILTTLKDAKSPLVAFLFDLRRLAFCGRLYLDQRDREGRAVPDQCSCARRWATLCDHGVGVRRHGAGGCALLQEPWA
jgi:MFS transporter, MHS family, alpha-ketoglutarate permease